MAYAISIGDERYDQYWQERFEAANNQLEYYPALKEVFKELSHPRDEGLQENPIVLELSAVDFGEGDRHVLRKIDGALHLVTNTLSKTKADDLITELRLNDRRVVLSRVLELLCYQYFIAQCLSVTPEPSLSNGGECDLLLNDQHPIYIEITRLGDADITLAIKTVFQAVGQELIGEISDDTHLNLVIDTGRLVWDSEQEESLQKQESQNLILNQFQSAHLDLLLDHYLSISLSDIQLLPDDWTIQYLIETDSLQLIDRYSSFGKKVKQQIENPAFQPVMTSSISEFKGPITHVSRGETKGKTVEIHSDDRAPSNVADDQVRVFLKRVKDNVETKIKRKQREPGEPNLLLIGASHWLVRGYSQADQHPILKGQEMKIRERVESILDKEQPEDLVGVVLMENNLFDSLLIDNPYTDQQIQRKFSETSIATQF